MLHIGAPTWARAVNRLATIVRHAHRSTLSYKVLLGIGGLTLLWSLTIIVAIGEFRRIERGVHEMSMNNAPIAAAVAALEVGAAETGAAVLSFVADPLPAAKRRIEQTQDMTVTRLDRLIDLGGPEFATAGERFRVRFADLRAIGQRLVAFREHETYLVGAFVASLGTFQRQLDGALPPLQVEGGERAELERRLVALRAELVSVVGRLSVNVGTYGQQGRDPATRDLVNARRLLLAASLHSPSLELAGWLRDVGTEMGRLASLTLEAERVRELIRTEMESFVAVRREIGDLLASDLQRIVERRAVRIGEDVDSVIGRGLATAIAFAIMGVLATGLVFFYVARHVMAPLDALAEGATRIGTGDFSTPISASSAPAGEISRLIDAFNTMMAQVSETQKALTGRATSLNDAVRARTTELERANAALLEAVEAADRANAAKSAFLAAMSHELRTPLNAIIGFSEVIAGDMLGPAGAKRYKEYAADITASGHHLLSIVNDLLDMVKIEAGKLELHIEQVEVAEIIDETMRMLHGRVSEAKLTCRIGVEKDLPSISADRRIAKQIVVNLLSNAIKFTPAGGAITVAARRDGRFVAIAVADTGIGMTADQVAKATEAFYQADDTLARRFGGTGLGLTLVKAFVEKHGGTFEIASEPNVGTTIAVRFPTGAVPAPPGQATLVVQAPQFAATARRTDD